MKGIGEQLKTAREKERLSQSKVVEMLLEKGIDMSRETLSKIENGNRSISAIELKALCDVLDIDIDNIFEEDDDLVTLFRKRNYSESTVNEIEKVQEMIKVFIYQKKIFHGEVKPTVRKPIWEEC